MLQAKSSTYSEDQLRMDWSLEVVIYSQTIVYVLPKDSVSHEDQLYWWNYPTPEGGEFRNQVKMIVSPFS